MKTTTFSAPSSRNCLAGGPLQALSFRPQVCRSVMAMAGLFGLLLVGTAHPPAAAQTAATAPAPAPARPASSEAQAGLERAQRQADNPLRHILKASRLPARVALADAPTAPTAAAAPAAPAVLLTLALPTTAATARAEAPALEAEAFGQGLSLRLTWPILPVLPADDPLVPEPEPEQPQLQTMLEPELDARMVDQLGQLKAVDAVLSLRTDGTVADVAFRGTVDLRLQRVVQRALMQWRYAPLREATEHLVRLEFSSPR